MGYIDSLVTNLHAKYHEKWTPLEVLRIDNKESIKQITEFFNVCNARGNHLTRAYVDKESVFFKDYESGLKKIEKKEVIYQSDKPLTFIVCADNVLMEDNKNLFIKYKTKIFGKELNELFDKLKWK